MHTTRRQFVFASASALPGLGLVRAASAADDANAVAAADAADRAPGAAGWPIYRGDRALCGVAAVRLPDKLALKWKFKTAGRGVKSSAVIGGGRAYIGADDANVYAIDLKTGQKVWAFAAEAAVEAPPMLLDETLYVGANDGYLYALNAATGQLKWKFETMDKVVGSANWMKSLDGQATWILVGSFDNHLYCLDSKTGRLVWKYETTSYINGTPAVADGLVVFGGCDAILHGVSVKEAEPKSQVQIEFDGYVAGSAAVYDGHAYVGHFGNKFVAADLTAGKIVWDYARRRFPFGASPAVTDKVVVFGGHDKHVHCIRRADGEELWAFRTRGNVDSSPVICGDRIIVGSDDGHLYLLGLAKGDEISAFEIGRPIISSPAVAEGVVVVGAEDGFVYCFTGA